MRPLRLSRMHLFIGQCLVVMKVFASAEAINIEEPSLFPASSLQDQGADDVQDVDDLQEAMLQDMYERTTEVSKFCFTSMV